MARKANKESVAAAENGPDYKGALALIRGDIREAKDETSTIGQRVGQDWKRIEKVMGLNRRGAQMFAGIAFLPSDTQADILRTFYGLVKEAGLSEFTDLVDIAEAGEAKPKAPPAAPQPIADHPSDDSDLAGIETVDGDEQGSVDLKTGMLVREDGSDIRQATSSELAMAREAQADFDKQAAKDKPKLKAVN